LSNSGNAKSRLRDMLIPSQACKQEGVETRRQARKGKRESRPQTWKRQWKL